MGVVTVTVAAVLLVLALGFAYSAGELRYEEPNNPRVRRTGFAVGYLVGLLALAAARYL